MSKIQVNGKEQILETASISVLELIKLNKVLNTDMVSVQLNGEFVDREEYSSTQLKTNDEVDFLYFMGGGAN
jgi:sulfur carrier protein